MACFGSHRLQKSTIVLVIFLATVCCQETTSSREAWHRPRLRHSRHLFTGDENAALTYSTSAGSDSVNLLHSNHKPVFRQCSQYRPSVKEEQDPGAMVFTVKAEDSDPPDSGGTVVYNFVTGTGERQKFHIDPNTGVVTTRHTFDRDEPTREKEAYITVRATDNGNPTLDAVCTVRIIIEDINDNQPVFDKVSYLESVPQDLPIGREVMRVSATDLDDGNNSVVDYAFKDYGEDYKYFTLDRSTGIIFLNKTIDKDTGYRFRMRAVATDRGAPPHMNEIDLEVQVIESNRRSPTFVNPPIDPIFLKEDINDFEAHLVTIQAESNIPHEKDLLFELVTGRTEQTNKLNTFILVSDKDIAYIKQGRMLDYESINEYTLTVRVQNKYNLAAETSIQIRLEDVNDNIPAFMEVTQGSVMENEPPGTPVMQVRAIDADGTSAHNIVTYELADNLNLFTIDKNTGNITTLLTFDREEKDFYNIKVIATDNSPSALYATGHGPNRGQQVFRIEINDQNDNKPHFTKDVYVSNAIAEDANINSLVTEVKALDDDTASVVSYSIVDGNTYDAFKVENLTGKIRVKTALDYENITKYRLGVRAFDGIYEDYAEVEIRIENVNDNPPVFMKDKITITIEEEELKPGCIAMLEAYDPDIKDRSAPQNIVYYIMREEQKRWLNIDNNGCLKLIEPLDRDPPNGFPRWQVYIAAQDENGGPTALRSLAEVNIELTDINDNAPFLTNKQPVVWYENQPPGKIVTLEADDNDSTGNGPPFLYRLHLSASDDIKSKFDIKDDVLNSLVIFNREEIKEYHIPIAITDNGNPLMTGVSNLHVVIGDINDNPMKSGESNIFVYNYKGEAPDTEIGRVYVEDPDDWDLPDKYFAWRDGIPDDLFALNNDNGMITMRQGTSNGAFTLYFTVTEESRFVSRHTVEAVVNITVKAIEEEAVDKSGSMRLLGITAEQFVEVPAFGEMSIKDRLRIKLAQLLNATLDNVDLFTVLHHSSNTSLLDIRYSAHGSPYYAPEKINGIIGQNQKEIEEELGLKVYMVNIDECLIEKQNCEASCRNVLDKSNVPISVYTNTTSFVGVSAIVRHDCTCETPPRVTCLNGGTPFDNYCECREGYEGPQCEIIGVGFYGDGWAMYPPLGACDSSTIALELTPQRDHGLVFYSGPLQYNALLPVQDFISLELVGGYPVLIVDYGTGSVRVEHKHIKLTDGKSHRIDISLQRTIIEMTVDSCKMSSCMSIGAPSGPHEFLNVNGPLILGGTPVNLAQLAEKFTWLHHPTENGFGGCIRNLTFNGKTYNLGMPSLSKNADSGCQRSLAKAISFGIDTNFLVAILVCIAILLILLLAVVVFRRKQDGWHEKDMDDIRENIINYEDEGGGEVDTGYDLNVLRQMYDDYPVTDKSPTKEAIQRKAPNEVPDICGFLVDKKDAVDKDPETNPFDDVRHYAYEGDGNTTGSLSSLASCTDDGDLKFNYLSNFGPRFRKLADMYGEVPSDTDSQDGAEESWC